jgi:hypothetical protein
MKARVGIVLLAALLVPGVAFASHTTYHGCAPCHTPHNAVGVDDDKVDVPLWSGQATSTTFTLYDSESLDTTPEQPTGSSALCLSCHDGSSSHTWVGSYVGGEWMYDTDGDGIGDTPANPDGSAPGNAIPKDSNFGNDLSHTHPVSIDYLVVENEDDFKLSGDVTSGYLRGKNGLRRVECASCHEVHEDNAATEHALRDGHTYEDAFGGGALCQECHLK